jgi:hypothetical protein
MQFSMHRSVKRISYMKFVYDLKRPRRGGIDRHPDIADQVEPR